MNKTFLLPIILLLPGLSYSQILHVGSSYPYPALDAALQVVMPGDTIQIHEGTYAGGLFEENVQGTSEAWITIEAAPGDMVIFDGGTNAWQFTDAAYLRIRGLIFQHQTGNGLNFDDGGTYDTPAHHIIFSDCTFRDMSANGNNDLLKISGLDSFQITQCMFINGAEEGSGIDMVGCHNGIVGQCHFENLGSNCIQMKGGTRNIRVERNYFKNGGQRTLNMGGSTDLQFFRPMDAPYEAADLKVYSNVFIGSLAPVAFVGCINSEVVNNTIYLPNKWVMRILQETVDTSRFLPCGHNSFVNNIMYIDSRVSTVCNIGLNTDAPSFNFANNFWFHSEDNSWPGPDLPAPDVNSIVGEDPLFKDAEQEDFSLFFGSLAIGSGKEVSQPVEDYIGNIFNHPRTIGAYEGNPLSGTVEISKKGSAELHVFPNPSNGSFQIELPASKEEKLNIMMFDLQGKMISLPISTRSSSAYLNIITAPGEYYLVVKGKTKTYISPVLIE